MRRQGRLAILRGAEGAQLLEFALVLPLLLVLVIGAVDFGGAYTLKDKLTNAARDASRIAVSQPNDLFNSLKTACNGVPCSVQSAATAVVNYLSSAGVNICGLNPSTTSPTAGPGPFAWTYSASAGCPGTMTIVVERQVLATINGVIVTMTRVTVSHPFRWTFGNVIQLLAPSSYPAIITVSGVAIMQNLN